MRQIPYDLGKRFDSAMSEAPIAEHLRPHFRRWLRFYLDFCSKYGFEPTVGTSFRPFNAKLLEKGQAEWKRRQAHQAVALYIRTARASDVTRESGSGKSGNGAASQALLTADTHDQSLLNGPAEKRPKRPMQSRSISPEQAQKIRHCVLTLPGHENSRRSQRARISIHYLQTMSKNS